MTGYDMVDAIRSVITEQREDITALKAENARLREELAGAPKCEMCEAMLDCDECLRADVSHKERRRLSAENDRLRELAKGLYEFAYAEYPSAAEAGFADDLRELCVEVDDG